MSIIEATDANGHLPELLGRVARGETITLTEGGRPVARLVPAKDAASADAPRRDVAEAVKEMLAYRDQQKRTLGGMSIRELIDEGRRF